MKEKFYLKSHMIQKSVAMYSTSSYSSFFWLSTRYQMQELQDLIHQEKVDQIRYSQMDFEQHPVYLQLELRFFFVAT
jgi:hypothetical protein